MTTPDPAVVLEIKKYPNRRLYDATRSCHVTAGEVYDLVAAGQTVRVRDSKSGEDITNQVLLQALFERDPLKISAVPPPLVHLMIRMNQPMMASWFDQFLRWTMESYRAAGRAAPAGWWSGWPGGGMGAGTWPGDWTQTGLAPGAGAPGAGFSPVSWMDALLHPPGAPVTPGTPPPAPADGPPDADPDDHPDDPASPSTGPDDDLARLRQQVAALAEEVERLRAQQDDG